MLEITIQFAEKCMTNVNSILSAGTKRFEISDTRLTTKYPELTIAANDILTCPSSTNQKKFLLLLKENKETVLFRKDLFYRIIQTLNLHSTNTDISIVDAANIFQRRFRHTGRLITHRIIGTTLLLKGLEFDHVVILYAESLSHKELYVALTRACKSISVITNQTYLPMTG